MNRVLPVLLLIITLSFHLFGNDELDFLSLYFKESTNYQEKLSAVDLALSMESPGMGDFLTDIYLQGETAILAEIISSALERERNFSWSFYDSNMEAFAFLIDQMARIDDPDLRTALLNYSSLFETKDRDYIRSQQGELLYRFLLENDGSLPQWLWRNAHGWVNSYANDMGTHEREMLIMVYEVSRERWLNSGILEKLNKN